MGWDSNPVEALGEREGDAFFRLQCEGALRRDLDLGPLRRVDLSLRGFDERYREVPREHRAQGEFRARLDHGLGRRGGSGRFELSTRARTYPDSTSRDFRRDRLLWDGRLPLGPRGALRPSVDLDWIRLEGSEIDDRFQIEVGLGYELNWRPGWVGYVGLDLGGARFERASIQVERDPDGEPYPVPGPSQEDDLRRIRFGVRHVGRWVLQLQYGYLSQTSNSLGASLGRHEVRWLVSRSLPGHLTGQFYGNVESTRYDDPELEDLGILRPGEELEAGDDNNLVAIQIVRTLTPEFRIHLRHTWFENESVFIGTFYRKRVASLALSWQRGSVSGF